MFGNRFFIEMAMFLRILWNGKCMMPYMHYLCTPICRSNERNATRGSCCYPRPEKVLVLKNSCLARSYSSDVFVFLYIEC
uniref:Putative secreted protein n=1 Tax=Ixodes ricinus TaxID=34613 RepID=A0A6B0U6C5_IXORI